MEHENQCELWLVTPGFDDLNLTGWNAFANGDRFELMAMAEGATWGNPVPVDVSVQRWMTDGAVAATQGHEDRTLQFTVRAKADTSRDLAAAEAALALRSARPCSLKWSAIEGEPDSPATVFEVWTWHLSHSLSLSDEVDLTRMYALEMTAKPWTRSADLTMVAAITTSDSPTTVQINACTSTAGWAGVPNSPTTSGGAVKETVPYTLGFGVPVAGTLRLTTSITGLDVTPYLMLDMSFTGGTLLNLSVALNGSYLVKAAQVGTVSYWQVTAGVTSATTLNVSFQMKSVSTSASNAVMSIADVSRTSAIGGVGSKKQISRSLAVGGSVPTSGSIQVASPSATALGTVMVHTFPDNGQGYTAGLRAYRFSGNTVTADSTAVSGSHEAFITAGVTAGAISYRMPPEVIPEATYAVLARLKSTIATTVTVTGATYTGAEVSTFSINTKVTWDSGAANQWIWAVIGAVSYPLLPVPDGSAQYSGLLISGTNISGTPTVTLDEVYLLDMTHGATTLVDCGTATRMWIDAPDADPLRNRPAIYLGTQSDRSDAAGATGDQIRSIGDHDLDPRGAAMLTVTDGVNNALVSASFFKRWHTHAGE